MMDDRTRRLLAIAGSFIFFLIAPVTVAGIVPWWISGWRFQETLLVLRGMGALLILIALPVLVDSFVRFAVEGLGTPAPVFPTRHLVVRGLYRYVRNPIYVALLAIILGQALFFGSLRLLEYAAVAWLFFHLFVLLYEEPRLRATFGPEYEKFCDNVPRWIPRFRPWDHSARRECR